MAVPDRPTFTRTVPSAGTPSRTVFSRNDSDAGALQPVAEGQGSFSVMGKYIESSYSATASGTYEADMANGSVHMVTVTADTVINLPEVEQGKAKSFVVIVTQDSTGGHTVTFESGTLWSGGSAPTISEAANAVSIVTLMTAGSSWVGFLAGADVA